MKQMKHQRTANAIDVLNATAEAYQKSQKIAPTTKERLESFTTERSVQQYLISGGRILEEQDGPTARSERETHHETKECRIGWV